MKTSASNDSCFDGLAFLSKILPSSGHYFVATLVKSSSGRAYFRHHLADSPAHAHVLAQALDQGCGNVYHACASYREPFVMVDVPDPKTGQTVQKKRERIQENVLLCRAFWIDLDVEAGNRASTSRSGRPSRASSRSSGRPGSRCRWSSRRATACTSTGRCRPTCRRPSGSRPHATSRSSLPRSAQAGPEPHGGPGVRAPPGGHIQQEGPGEPAARYARARRARVPVRGLLYARRRRVPKVLNHTVDGEETIHKWSSGYKGYSRAETAQKIIQVKPMI